MTLGRRRSEHQNSFWVATDKLGKGPRNAFYDRLNELLAEVEFDRKLEEAAAPYYQTTGPLRSARTREKLSDAGVGKTRIKLTVPPPGRNARLDLVVVQRNVEFRRARIS